MAAKAKKLGGAFPIISDVKATSKALTKIWHKISELPAKTKVGQINQILETLAEFVSNVDENRESILKSVALARSAAEQITTDEDDPEINTTTVEMEHAKPNYDISTAGISSSAAVPGGGIKHSPGSLRRAAKQSPASLRKGQKPSPSNIRKSTSPLIPRKDIQNSPLNGRKTTGSKLNRTVSAPVKNSPKAARSIESKSKLITSKSDGAGSADVKIPTTVSEKVIVTKKVSDASKSVGEVPEDSNFSNKVLTSDKVDTAGKFAGAVETVIAQQRSSNGKIDIADVAAEAMRKKQARKAEEARKAAFDEIAAAAREADAERMRIEAAKQAAALMKNPWSAVSNKRVPSAVPNPEHNARPEQEAITTFSVSSPSSIQENVENDENDDEDDEDDLL